MDLQFFLLGLVGWKEISTDPHDVDASRNEEKATEPVEALQHRYRLKRIKHRPRRAKTHWQVIRIFVESDVKKDTLTHEIQRETVEEAGERERTCCIPLSDVASNVHPDGSRLADTVST